MNKQLWLSFILLCAVIGGLTYSFAQPAGTNTASIPQLTRLTFAGLPANPVQGMIATITDGLAGSCGDASCTTFGTTVTGGGGALKLLVWYNGANWTLSGK